MNSTFEEAEKQEERKSILKDNPSSPKSSKSEESAQSQENEKSLMYTTFFKHLQKQKLKKNLE